ncbi:apolipoprotein N-acyltransferase [Soonwooa sp.]|uniref:apolipoprotein N-acyltransferase n=1 Tax=Soonwooa sp. TaxID=1938592 RepID=UPI002626DE27|nr:apolipoprotein N-acyltransferase [Soonwooa sp.]
MKYIILSLISALLFCVSWPTYGVPYFIFLAFVPLLLVEHEITKFSKIKHKSWAVFGLSYLVFIIWNIVTTGWLYNSLNPDGSHSLMAVVFPVVVNSLLMSLTFQFYHWYKKSQGTYFGLVFFVAIWMVFEKFHLSWELTWPWLNLGNVFADQHQFIQWYDTLGATGGSLWILLVNVLAFYTIRIWEAGRQRKSLIINTSLVVGLAVIPMLISYLMYFNYEEKPVGSVNVSMLQPDLDPYKEKYQKDSITIVSDLLNIAGKNSVLDTKHNPEKIDIYLAPETSFPGYGSISERGFHNSLLINDIKSFLSQHPKTLFVGGVSTYYVYQNEEEKNQKSKTASLIEGRNFWVDEYNSAVQIIPNQNVEVYHKGKLVPGVEIFPYMNVLKPLLGDAMLNMGGTVHSLGIDQERKAFSNPFNKAKLAPIICYESIYGEFTNDYVKKGANLLTIVTNDSWWGFSQGHKQLLAYAKLRAIETRREIVRAANSGTSAHINARGDILEELPYGAQGALTAKANLLEGETFYVRTGDLWSRICMFVVGFLICFIPGRKYLNRK